MPETGIFTSPMSSGNGWPSAPAAFAEVHVSHCALDETVSWMLLPLERIVYGVPSIETVTGEISALEIWNRTGKSPWTDVTPSPLQATTSTPVAMSAQAVRRTSRDIDDFALIVDPQLLLQSTNPAYRHNVPRFLEGLALRRAGGPHCQLLVAVLLAMFARVRACDALRALASDLGQAQVSG